MLTPVGLICAWIRYRESLRLPVPDTPKCPVTAVILDFHYFSLLFSFAPLKQRHRLNVARYLQIDVRFCARSRKHILSKRKQVHTSGIAHSQMQTNAIFGKIDIHITVLTIEVYYHIFKTCFAFALTN